MVMLYSFHRNNQGMSVTFDPVDSKKPSNSLVPSVSTTSLPVEILGSSTSPISTTSSFPVSTLSSSPTKLSSAHKLIAFPSNPASSSSLSVSNHHDVKNEQHQPNDDQHKKLYLNGACLTRIKHCTPSTTISVTSDYPVKGLERLDNLYPTITLDTKLNREWYSTKKRQIDEILARLEYLHKANLDDRESIEGMKKKTIKLIATYSTITMKTNNFLTRWDRKYGFKLKPNHQTSTVSPTLTSTSSLSPSSTFSSSGFYDEKYEPGYLFNSTPIW